MESTTVYSKYLITTHTSYAKTEPYPTYKKLKLYEIENFPLRYKLKSIFVLGWHQKRGPRTGATTAQSVLRLATGWTVRGSNPGGGARFSAPVQTGPEAHPASYTMGTGSFPGVKRPGRGVDHQPSHLAPRLKEQYSYISAPPLGLRGLL